MLSFPNCKINLGLSIINKRSDGYHNLETIFYPLPVNDALEIIPSSLNNQQHTGLANFTTSGLPISGNNVDNLCFKAWLLLKEDFPRLPSIKMHLHKAIPMGAGLGGGSADGAYVLMLLNELFDLGLSKYQLINYAIHLGSDCPFFIFNMPCFGKGRGEILEPVALDLSPYSFVLVNAGILINTGWAFSKIDASATDNIITPGDDLRDIIAGGISSWKERLINDFEKPVFEEYPEIKWIKEALYKYGALYASMTGSGSTVYGIFENDAEPDFSFPPGYQVMKA